MIIEYYDTYEYREQLLLLMDSDSKLQFLAAATYLGDHSLIVTLYNYIKGTWHSQRPNPICKPVYSVTIYNLASK